MEFITVGELYSLASKENSLYYKKVESLIETLDRSGILVTIDEEHVFYPKKLFCENENIELIFFSSEAIIVTTIDDYWNVTVQKFLNKDIRKLELVNLNIETVTVELIIHVNDQESIKLSNKKDTNTAWATKFFKKIVGIFAKFS
ncbi:DUF3908 family protein [Bacillus cereus]|uniref:DUF3908 family protein n=1 Tax=Bacillus cereus TaxID=1396 RepID=UPI000BF89230|nr:DUF3908 family protein [Bacillus cereus]PFR51028.1 hypothetical protein COK35_07610 [Bacillus cereus]